MIGALTMGGVGAGLSFTERFNVFSPTGPVLTDPQDQAGIAAITTALANMTPSGHESAFASVVAHEGGKAIYLRNLALVGALGAVVGAVGYALVKKMTR